MGIHLTSFCVHQQRWPPPWSEGNQTPFCILLHVCFVSTNSVTHLQICGKTFGLVLLSWSCTSSHFSPLSFLPPLIAVCGAITSYITNTSGMHILQAWPYNWRLNIFPKAWGGRLVVLLVQPHSSFIFHSTLHPVCHYQLWFAVLNDCESLHLFKTYSVFRTSTVLSRFFCAQEFCFFSFTWSKKSLMKGPHSLLQEWVTKREEVSLTSVKSMTHVERSPGLDLQAQSWFRLSQLAL